MPPLLLMLDLRGQTPLHFGATARKQTLGICQLLLARGAAPDIADASGRVPYELADSDQIRTLLGGPDGRCEACHRSQESYMQENANAVIPELKKVGVD